MLFSSTTGGRVIKLLVDLYVKFHQEAEENPKLDGEAREWFHKLETGDSEARRIWERCVDWSWIEFDKIYKLDVTVIPTNKAMIRQDLPDRIYKNEEAKFRAVAQEIKERNQKGQPVLVGTISIEKNELLGEMLRREGIEPQILNAKFHEKEAQIISQAGQYGAVTVATNMAGRGVDIKLGGDPIDPEEEKKVKAAGGLLIVGTERHESRRIDNQLRGRGGRQGDPGASQFYVSLDDDLMRIFGAERIKKLMETLKVPEDMPIENRMISRSLEAAQKKS